MHTNCALMRKEYLEPLKSQRSIWKKLIKIYTYSTCCINVFSYQNFLEKLSAIFFLFPSKIHLKLSTFLICFGRADKVITICRVAITSNFHFENATT